ncbi:dihydropteroate synthase [Shewanella halifaxensis HAW-EB4]|uniref:Dihydropteroate synthase n=1 Tax=Shewanella halifaxensis (strain HAW-EB4) TaxID=458817 RepID=B0TQA8_SHEHH|nr:dihydropteroate synthase [Shewanella halifaxensis]ABZ77700.1 dihydropteroate synthase [Shewanella halifaxensis HAW-EB4]
MGILNVTPDSFSDGGEYSSFETACRQADLMVAQGAKIIDIGGESTRPGAKEVSVEDELARVLPLIDYVSRTHKVWISIDTSKATVMKAAVEAGAHLINDVRALQEAGALDVAAQLGVPVCLMHMQGQPRTMQDAPHYEDIISDISQFFCERIDACLAAGIRREQIVLDPGFGFGKSLAHNYELLNRMPELLQLGLPVLAGLSRKSMFGQLLGREVSQRLSATLTGNMLAIQAGAKILRVHDVQETSDMLAVLSATRNYNALS